MVDQHPISLDDDTLYFELQADFGITKHLGGLKATRELLASCHVGEGQYVLEVGCGIGSTTCYIAKQYGCRVVGIDISTGMVAKARGRARRRGLDSRIEFRVADAQSLPFADGTFDAVIDESVTAFVGDKCRALAEYARVVKPGHYVGLNEVTWIKTPSPELVKYVALLMARADFLEAEGWEGVLTGAGLRDVTVRSYKFDARSQYIEEIRQLDLGEYARAWYRFLTQSFTSPAYRKFAREVFGAPRNIFRFMGCIGYGLYIGRK